MSMKIPMTREGYDKIKEDLERFIKVERPRNIQDIAEARAHGDLSENAEYHAAKERQSYIEGKIQELQGKIAHAHIIETKNLTNDKVVFGCTVLLLDTDTDEEKKYTLVGQEEANLKNGKISIQSPVGKALISKKVGDVITVQAPAKTIEYEILEISIE
ncbi:MAG: transcription elongation factor GreA [Nitrospirota bacterium]|nr:transcription elongation factor GreA [Nitrospirota bacterium]